MVLMSLLSKKNMEYWCPHFQSVPPFTSGLSGCAQKLFSALIGMLSIFLCGNIGDEHIYVFGQHENMVGAKSHRNNGGIGNVVDSGATGISGYWDE